jgi:hypothetical protein
MKVKDEVDLANVLGMAFSGYANRVQNGLVTPYQSFLKGETTVTVNITLNDDGSVTIQQVGGGSLLFVAPDIVEVQPEKLFSEKEQTEEVLVNTSDVPEKVEFLNSTSDVVEPEVKPKRKRKR